MFTLEFSKYTARMNITSPMVNVLLRRQLLQAAKEAFENNMQHHDIMKTIS